MIENMMKNWYIGEKDMLNNPFLIVPNSIHLEAHGNALGIIAIIRRPYMATGARPKITFFKIFSRNPWQFQKEIVTLWCGI